MPLQPKKAISVPLKYLLYWHFSVNGTGGDCFGPVGVPPWFHLLTADLAECAVKNRLGAAGSGVRPASVSLSEIEGNFQHGSNS